MNESLQQKLYDAGPELYKLRFLPCPEESLMGWGIHCPDEWFPRLLLLTQILEAHNQLHPDDMIHAIQVKTKFGKLRFHMDHECRMAALPFPAKMPFLPASHLAIAWCCHGGLDFCGGRTALSSALALLFHE